MSRRSYGVVLLSIVVLCALVLMSISGLFAPAPGKARLAVNEGWINGQVTNSTGPIANAYIIYILGIGGGEPLGAAWTNSTGNYNLTVQGGITYMIIAFDANHYSTGGMAAPPIGGSATCNLSMNPIAPLTTDVTLTGYVLDGGGDPVPGGNVIGFILDPLNGGEGAPKYGNVTTADPGTGRYTVNVLPGAIGGGVAVLGVPGYGFIQNQTSQPLESGHTYWFNITLSVQASTDDASISGTVTDANNGTPLENAVVTIQTQNSHNGQMGYSNFTTTNATGFYSMNVTNGTGRIVFQKTGYTMAQDDNFHISAGQHLWVNASLVQVTATISGNVTDLKTGLPIENAQVYTMDSSGHFTSGTTNSAGAYSMDAVDGADIFVGSGASGYSNNYSRITILPGEHLWKDFGLWPLDSWLSGTVTDILNGTPIVGASVNLHSSTFDDSTMTNVSGGYNLTLLSGTYSISVNANNYSSYHEIIGVDPGGNSYSVGLMPINPLRTTKLYGWINDTVSGTGLDGASIQVELAPPFSSERVGNTTEPDGYYEMWVVPTLLDYLATNNSHMHANGTIDATNQTEVRLDISLARDPWGPNVTYSQSPTQNVSWTNPSWINFTVEERDPMQFVLIHFMYLNSSHGWADYAIVQMFYTNFDPLGYGQSGLPYAKAGDTYTFSMKWTAESNGGWLTNGTTQMYFASAPSKIGVTDYQALRGSYTNSSMNSSMPGTAWFDNVTGAFVFFAFDDGSKETAMPSDPTGIFSPQISLLRVNESTNSTMWMGEYNEGSWGVSGLRFVYDTTLPSGRYITEFSCQDFGNKGAGNGTYDTVDNDPPVANAGADQTVPEGQVMSFDGTLSSDNVGIANYTWTFDNGGTPVTLWGPNPTFTFTAQGVYNVTLTVTDGAGHTSTSHMTVTVSQPIPEFPALVLPIAGMMAIMALYQVRRRGRAQ